MVKNPPAMQESQVLSLSLEDPLEKGMATTPVSLPGKSHGQRSLVGYIHGVTKELDMTKGLTFSLFSIFIYIYIYISYSILFL